MFIRSNILLNNLLLFVFLTSFFVFINMFFVFTVDKFSFDAVFIFYSLLLFFLLSYVLIIEKNKLSALVFFSLLFYGYVLSGLYFSFYENIYTAKFFNYFPVFDINDLKMSLIFILVGYLFFVVGYKLSSGINVKKISFRFDSLNFESGILKLFLIFLFLISFLYWVVFSYKLAGGPLNLLLNIGVFKHLLDSSYISTAPFRLAYAATSVLFLILLKSGGRVPFYLFLMIVLSFIMYLSTGRLSGAVFYLLSFILIYIIFNNKKINLKYVLYFSLIFVFLAFLYFFRLFSNLSYIGKDVDFSALGSLVGVHFFGMANIGDLQSVAFSIHYTLNFGYLYGASFLDFFNLWFGRITGFEIENNSVGLRLSENYFSGFETGAPAPGIISEMIINFGVLGVTLVIFLFGMLTRLIEKSIFIRSNIINVFIYVKFVLFLTLLAKVDSSHLSSLVWAVVPVLLLLYLSTYISRLRL